MAVKKKRRPAARQKSCPSAEGKPLSDRHSRGTAPSHRFAAEQVESNLKRFTIRQGAGTTLIGGDRVLLKSNTKTPAAIEEEENSLSLQIDSISAKAAGGVREKSGFTRDLTSGSVYAPRRSARKDPFRTRRGSFVEDEERAEEGRLSLQISLLYQPLEKNSSSPGRFPGGCQKKPIMTSKASGSVETSKRRPGVAIKKIVSEQGGSLLH